MSNFDAGKTDIWPLCSQAPAVNWLIEQSHRLFGFSFKILPLCCEEFPLGKHCGSSTPLSACFIMDLLMYIYHSNWYVHDLSQLCGNISPCCIIKRGENWACVTLTFFFFLPSSNQSVICMNTGTLIVFFSQGLRNILPGRKGERSDIVMCWHYPDTDTKESKEKAIAVAFKVICILFVFLKLAVPRCQLNSLV